MRPFSVIMSAIACRDQIRAGAADFPQTVTNFSSSIHEGCESGSTSPRKYVRLHPNWFVVTRSASLMRESVCVCFFFFFFLRMPVVSSPHYKIKLCKCLSFDTTLNADAFKCRFVKERTLKGMSIAVHNRISVEQEEH